MTRRTKKTPKRRPGEVRDAVLDVLKRKQSAATVSEIEQEVRTLIGSTPSSSIRSYLRLNSNSLFLREERGLYCLREAAVCAQHAEISGEPEFTSVTAGQATIIRADCFEWLRYQAKQSIHAVVTDPPYSLIEYEPEQQKKLRNGKGGVWRIPPSFDGTRRSPLPRFTVLSAEDLKELDQFFYEWARLLLPVLVPGANVVVASNPLLSYIVSGALARAGLERRGEIIRLVMTMRGGDRPKDAHEEFFGVSVMPRSQWEPWLLFRKPLEGRVQDNLRKWSTGGFRRPSKEQPFGDVIASSPTHKHEREIASHPSLKPQSFMRVVVRGVLPLGEGVVLDPFAGAGSTLAAAEANGYKSIGIEKDPEYFRIARDAIPKLASYKNGRNHSLVL